MLERDMGLSGQGLEEKKIGANKRDEAKMLYTIEEAARLLNLKISRLRMAVFKKEISYVKLGALVRFRITDIENFISKNLILVKAF